MARTKQTARVSTGGKAPRKTAAKGVASARKRKSNNASIGGISFPSSNNGKEENQLIEEEEEAVEEVEITSDITYATSFYAHYFESGQELTKVFQPRYAISKTQSLVLDPSQSPQDEYWLSANFNSKYDGEGLAKHGRPTLSLVIALDVSGSMQCEFPGSNDYNNSKLKVAKQALKSILSQLKADDTLGIIIFNSAPTTVFPLTKCGDIDTVKLEKNINRWRAEGGTELTEAFNAATTMLSKAKEGANTSKRIFFLTDMESGSDDCQEFVNTVKKNSDDSMWTTIVGIGEDLTSRVIEDVSNTVGCNYCNVRSPEGFQELVEKEFGYLVTPIGFNIQLEIPKTSDFIIERGYGTTEVEQTKEGGAVAISTEFPSLQNEKGERRGGIMLFKLKRVRNLDQPFSVEVSLQREDLLGVIQTDIQQLKLEEGQPQDMGIRKAILLVQYTDLVKEYLAFRKERQAQLAAGANPGVLSKVLSALSSPFRSASDNNNGQQQGVSYRKKLEQFKQYFEKEKIAIGDDSLSQELELLDKFLSLEPADEPIVAVAAAPQVDNNNNAQHQPMEIDNSNNNNNQVVPSEGGSSPKVAKVDGAAIVDEPLPPSNNADESSECVVCLTNKKNILLLPCKHACLCSSCANSTVNVISDCPLCRTAIAQKVNIFL